MMPPRAQILKFVREQNHAFALRDPICHATAGLLSVETNNRNEPIEAETLIRSTKIFAHAKIFAEKNTHPINFKTSASILSDETVVLKRMGLYRTDLIASGTFIAVSKWMRLTPLKESLTSLPVSA